MHAFRRFAGLLVAGLLAAPLTLTAVPAYAGATASPDASTRPQRVFHSHSEHRGLTPRTLGTAYLPADVLDAYASAIPSSVAGTGATVASVQFSGWSQLEGTRSGGDLVEYARANGLPVPDVTAISVNGAPVDEPAFPGDDFEVALDQEAILAAAPGARQRVYVSTNDEAGGVLVWKRIADDVAAGVPISVVTTSWGSCEQDLGTTQILAMEKQIERLAALGVTIFAASGDNAAYDCATGSPNARTVSVDFPASSPFVVGVGGTTLRDTSGGWTESAWGPSLLTTEPAAGSGGGVSAVFRRPAWQAGVPGLPDRRLVPDISAVADPQNGFAVYWTGGDGTDPWWSAGGTSLGAPLQAGMFAAALAARGITTGVGEVHPALYAHPESFRDVVTGTNGVFPADLGYDLVTGLGSPLWSALADDVSRPAIVAPAATRTGSVTAALAAPPSATAYAVGPGVTDCSTATAGTPPPTAQVTLGTAGSVGFAVRTATGGCTVTSTPVATDTTAPIGTATLARYGDTLLRLSWDGTDATPSGLGYAVVLERNGAPWLTTYATTGRSLAVSVPATGIYQLRVQAADGAGNADGWRTTQALGPRGTCPLFIDGQPRCWAR